MFKNMKRKVAAVLAAVSLMTVATGALADYGEAAKDNASQPRYQVGQEVEVYNSGFHYTTKRMKIVDTEKYDMGVFTKKESWRYHVQSVEYHTYGDNDEWVNADAIQV